MQNLRLSHKAFNLVLVLVLIILFDHQLQPPAKCDVKC